MSERIHCQQTSTAGTSRIGKHPSRATGLICSRSYRQSHQHHVGLPITWSLVKTQGWFSRSARHTWLSAGNSCFMKNHSWSWIQRFEAQIVMHPYKYDYTSSQKAVFRVLCSEKGSWLVPILLHLYFTPLIFRENHVFVFATSAGQRTQTGAL
jgi:hypothetical protein